jgi:hypothetical protein
MIKKYISKFTIDILPSIIATIVGAYIVNHYIVPKSDGNKPAAAMASTAEPKPDSLKPAAKPAETSSDIASVPASAAKASDKPNAEKAADSPASTRRHQPAPREKAAAKTTPPAVSVPAAAASAVATPETPPAADERRDANDLARAAIERLRNANEAQRAQDAARITPETPRTAEPRIETPRIASAPAVQQLPPPINVSQPSVEMFDVASPRPTNNEERPFDPRRPRPPGDIPQAQPLDIEADATGSTRRERTSVAEDVLSAAKSVFHSLPRPFER